jgi:hypothetical protein
MIRHVAEYVKLNWMDAFLRVCVGFQSMVLELAMECGRFYAGFMISLLPVLPDASMVYMELNL